MTVPVTGITPVYGLEYLVQGEPMRHTRAKLERTVLAIEAALVSGGIAPPEAQDLAQLVGRVTALEQAPRVTVTRASTLAVPGSTFVSVPFSSATSRSSSGMWAPGAATRLLVPAPGEYDVTVLASFANLANPGGRALYVQVNGDASKRFQVSGWPTNAWTPATDTSRLTGLELAPGDYVELLVWQNSDPSVSLQAGARMTLERAR